MTNTTADFADARPARATIIGWRYQVDRLPTIAITAGVLVALVPFGLHLSLPLVALLWLVSFALRVITPVHQHCHAHHQLFGHPLFNHAYDTVLMLAGGNVTAIWELQHVEGHHRALLEPANDPANSRRFGNGGRWHRAIFTVAGDALSWADSWRLAARRRNRRRLALRLVLQTLVQAALLSGLALLNWKLTLAFWVVPAVLLRWSVFWFSYAQHHDMPNTDVYSSSVTHFHWSNRIFLNIGHHTAHHEKPTLHWSLLPARTAQIRHRIPDVCLQ